MEELERRLVPAQTKGVKTMAAKKIETLQVEAVPFMTDAELLLVLRDTAYFTVDGSEEILKAKKARILVEKKGMDPIFVVKRFSQKRLLELASTANELGQTDIAKRIIAVSNKMKAPSTSARKTPPTSTELENKTNITLPINSRNQGVIVANVSYAFALGTVEKVKEGSKPVSVSARYGKRFIVIAKNEQDADKAMKHLATMK